MKALWFEDAKRYIETAASDPSLLSSIGDNPFLNDMERELERFLGLPKRRAVAVSSATAGLTATLRALGIREGDEVILPALSWGQTLSPILEVGASPLFVDLEKGGVNLDLSRTETAITKRTKAILAAELFGIPLNWEKLDEIAQKYGVFTIVDAAQSFGASHQGPWPTAVVFSFGRGKQVCGGEGGAVVVSDERTYDALLITTQHPIRVLQNSLSDLPFELVDSVAPNARIHPFSAALITSEIRRLRENLHESRKLISQAREILSQMGLQPVPLPPGTAQAPPLIPLMTDRGERLREICRRYGWRLEKNSRKPLPMLPSVKMKRYLPALLYLGFPTKRIKLRHTSKRYPQTMRCSEQLYLIHLDGRMKR